MARCWPLRLRRGWLPRRLVLGGVGDAVLAAARTAGRARLRQTRQAPWVDLGALRREAADYLERLSANTRYQVRRSDRGYAAQAALALHRASTVAEAHAWLDELAALHQATWTRRGLRGAFANPFFGRFHRALIDRGMARGEIDLLRVAAGDRVIGFLYNFRYRGRALAYQSGFDYASAGRHEKPGLTCHHQAIRFAAASGLDVYDFLAGEDRYKLSLADERAALHWVEVGPAAGVAALVGRVVSMAVQPGRRGGFR